MRYAQNTEVSIERSEAEIKKILQRYGAWEIVTAWRITGAMIGFRYHNRAIKFELPLPNRKDKEFCQTPNGRDRCESAARAAWEQACRQRWRALKMVIHAKLEAVKDGITTFDDEFLAHIIMPNGCTIGQALVPKLDSLANSKQVVGLLMGPVAKKEK